MPSAEQLLLQVIADERRPVAAWKSLASKATGGLQVLLLARAVGEGAATRALKAAISSLPKVSAKRRKALTTQAHAVVEYGRRTGTGTALALSRLAEAIGSGGDESYLLREAARVLDTDGASQAALGFITAALAIAPKGRGWYRDTLALVLINLGRFRAARQQVKKLAPLEPGQARWLGAYLTALCEKPTGLWLKSYVEGGIADDAAPGVRSVAEANEALSLVAARVRELVKGIRKLPGGAALSLPQVSALKPGKVDADFALGPGLADRLVQLRVEWTRLNWLIVALGGDRIARVKQVGPPPDPFNIIETLLVVRFNLLLEVCEGRKPKATDRLDTEALALTWGGVPMKALAPHLALYWLGEVSASLAVVRWATGQYDSVFADP